MEAKDQLLGEIDSITPDLFHFGTRYLINTFMVVIMVLILAFPKIYLQSQIYYKSRDIAQMKREYNALKEENALLRAKVESIRFKNQVLNTIF